MRQQNVARVLWFGAGAGLGSVIGLLIAPQSGAATRGAIARKVTGTRHDYFERGRDLYERGRHIADEAADLFEEARKLVENARGAEA